MVARNVFDVEPETSFDTGGVVRGGARGDQPGR
jgi:hypothetical protein